MNSYRHARRAIIRPTSAKLALSVIERREREETDHGGGTYLKTTTGLWIQTSTSAYIRVNV